MTNDQYKLIPLEKTQSIPIRWVFSQGNYDNLTRGHRSNWCVFLRDEVVHVCRVGGEEFYRFTLTKISEGSYETSGLEMYADDDFHTSLKQSGRTDEEVEQHRSDIRSLAVEETVGLLNGYFGITVN